MDSLLVWTTCAQNGLRLSDEQLRQLDVYAVRLLEWNKKINLVSRRDEENFWTRHILHCISLMFKVEFDEGVKILDLGTGGGLPGVVLKIARPDLLFTLLDSTRKKIDVVRDLLGSLGLAGIDAVWGRAEDLGKQREHAGQHDIVVARGVAALKDLALWSYPLLKRSARGVDTRKADAPGSAKKRVHGPTLIAFKGGNLDDEIKELRKHPNVGPISTIELTLNGSTQLDDRDKKVVIVEFARSIRQKAE
ncbi:MAG: 16S rRNA (guanine(527)-N(7))-methyltransferase RsmG [Ignavibacteriales bacterium]|nr:16S rRNA (guanine(527)-N(7))-methyltransferase RsmG [Ignavibacteriales bacterium]